MVSIPWHLAVLLALPFLAACSPRGGRIATLSHSIEDEHGDREYHTFFFDATRRLLFNNWPTSRVVEFDDSDGASNAAARAAIKHTDFSFLWDKKVMVEAFYEGTRM